ncbi:Protein phosphatase methylesterase 1 [Oleoguttula sp. CCFEE 5521]
MPGAGVLALEARGHGSSVTGPDGAEVLDYSLETLTTDALNMLLATSKALDWPGLPPLLLIGHSLGGAIMTTLATTHWRTLGSALVGYAVLDVVEGSALEALSHMKTYLSSRPRSFTSIAEAIDWHLRSRTIRSRESAEASVPSLLINSPSNTGSYTWRTDLSTTSSAWEGWFQGMSARFLTGRGAKLLILAGTDRLDKELMIGQMQGKFQLVVLPEAGHFVHEDVPAKVAGLLVEFWKRNDRSAMVLPPKVGELLAMGKKRLCQQSLLQNMATVAAETVVLDPSRVALDRVDANMTSERSNLINIAEPAHTEMFDFFRLPRELRDWVYGHLYEDLTTPHLEREQTNTWDYRGRIPFVNARLISRHFKSEYDQMSRVHHLLQMEDHADANMDEPGCLAIPRWFTKTVELEIDFLVTWCGDGHGTVGWYALDFGISLLKQMLVKFNELEALNLMFCFEKRSGALDVWRHIRSRILELSTLRRVQRVDVISVTPGPLQRQEDSASKDPSSEASDEGSDQSDSDADDVTAAEAHDDPPDYDVYDHASWDYVYQGEEPRGRPVTTVVATWTEQGLNVDGAEVKVLKDLDD